MPSQDSQSPNTQDTTYGTTKRANTSTTESYSKESAKLPKPKLAVDTHAARLYVESKHRVCSPNHVFKSSIDLQNPPAPKMPNPENMTKDDEVKLIAERNSLQRAQTSDSFTQDSQPPQSLSDSMKLDNPFSPVP